MKYLFKNTLQLCEHVGFDINTNFDAIKRELAWCERTYIAKYLGSNQYNALLTAYNDGSSISDSDQELLDKVQPALANLTIAHFATTKQVSISEAGTRISVTADKKTAFQWQKEEVSREYFMRGFNLLEDLLSFLEANKDTYTAWRDQSYTVFKEFLINDAVTFSTHYQISDSRRLFLAMRPAMRKVEVFTISPAITSGLVDKLKARIKDDSINGSTDADKKYKVLLILLQPAVANLTISRAVLELPVVIGHDTIYLNEIVATEGKTEKMPAADMLAQLRDQTYQDGMMYLDLAIEWLKANATEDLFEDFYAKITAENGSRNGQAGKRIYGAF